MVISQVGQAGGDAYDRWTESGPAPRSRPAAIAERRQQGMVSAAGGGKTRRSRRASARALPHVENAGWRLGVYAGTWQHSSSATRTSGVAVSPRESVHASTVVDRTRYCRGRHHRSRRGRAASRINRLSRNGRPLQAEHNCDISSRFSMKFPTTATKRSVGVWQTSLGGRSGPS